MNNVPSAVRVNYGSKAACEGAWLPPVSGSEHIHARTKDYYDRQAQKGLRVRQWAGYRAKCSVCGKDCAMRTNGTIGAHVDNSGGPESRARRAHRFTNAGADLLRLRSELQGD